MNRTYRSQRPIGPIHKKEIKALEKHKPRVLIIEDDEYSREAIEHLLKAEGCETRSVIGGVSGYCAARRFFPDVVVLDLNLPDIDGERVLRKLRGNRVLGEVPIIVITGYNRDEIPIDVSSSADFCFTKPASFDEVIQAVFDLLRRGAAPAGYWRL
jgi:DNA-binding response OmpR family regulator